MRWPKGKYNGDRIDGFKISLTIHLLHWFWMPKFYWNFGEPCFACLFFTIRGKTNYEARL